MNIVIFQVAMILGMRWLVDNHFKESLVSTLLHPFGLLFLILVCLNTLVQWTLGTGVCWKERLYNKGTGIQ